MTVINPNSISGITSITLPSGGDNVLTIHTNDGTERFRIDSSGNVKVGSACTISQDGDVFFTGVCTATTLSGAASGLTGTLPAISGANLTNLPAANITGTLPAISAANLTNVPAANITGTLPAIDGSNLTGIGGGITYARAYRLNSTYTLSASNADLTSNWEYDDDASVGSLGSGWSLPSSGIFSFPATGIYEVKAHSMFYTGGGTNTPYAGIALQGTTNNSSYSSRAAAYSSQSDDLGTARYHNVHASAIFDVTNTSNVKFKITTFKDVNYGDCAFMGDSGDNYTYVEVIRLGDT